MLCLIAIKDSSIITAIIGLIGILIGFFLGEISGWIRGRLRIKRLKKGLDLELKSILRQIPCKNHTIKKAIDSLSRKRILNPSTVMFPTVFYKSSIVDLYEHLTDSQRTALHIIYGIIDETEKFLAVMEKDIVDAINFEKIDKPYETFIKLLGDISIKHEHLREIINSYLSGKPIDVLEIKN